MAQWVEIWADDGRDKYFLYYAHKDCGVDYREQQDVPDRKLSLRPAPWGDRRELICEICSEIPHEERVKITQQKRDEDLLARPYNF